MPASAGDDRALVREHKAPALMGVHRTMNAHASIADVGADEEAPHVGDAGGGTDTSPVPIHREMPQTHQPAARASYHHSGSLNSCSTSGARSTTNGGVRANQPSFTGQSA